jgi:hypothetical protein
MDILYLHHLFFESKRWATSGYTRDQKAFNWPDAKFFIPDNQLLNFISSTLYCIIQSNNHIFALEIIILNQVKKIVMKKVIFAISFLAITTFAIAGNNSAKTASPEKVLDFSIQSQVAAPNFLLEREGMHTAEIHFTVNPDGTVNVKDVVSDEQDLKENIAYQMKNITVNTTGLDLKDTYKIVLRFNIL